MRYLIIALFFIGCAHPLEINNQYRIDMNIPLVEPSWQDGDSRSLFWQDTAISLDSFKFVHTDKYIIFEEDGCFTEIDYYFKLNSCGQEELKFTSTYDPSLMKIKEQYVTRSICDIGELRSDTIQYHFSDTASLYIEFQ